MKEPFENLDEDDCVLYELDALEQGQGSNESEGDVDDDDDLEDVQGSEELAKADSFGL